MTPVTPDASHSMRGDERDRGGLADLRRPLPEGTKPAATQAPPGRRPPLAIVRLCLLPPLLALVVGAGASGGGNRRAIRGRARHAGRDEKCCRSRLPARRG